MNVRPPKWASGYNALQQFQAAHVRFGSLATEPVEVAGPSMSALGPIATELVQCREMTRWAKSGCEQTQQYHLAAAFILEKDPANYEFVRRVLGHKNLQTTINFYVGLETVDAVRKFSAIALEDSGKGNLFEQARDVF